MNIIIFELHATVHCVRGQYPSPYAEPPDCQPLSLMYGVPVD